MRQLSLDVAAYCKAAKDDPALYFDSFFLNLRGRKLFTRRVLRDIGLIGSEK